MARGHILQPVGQIGVVRGGWCSRHQHPEAALAVVEAWQRLVLDGLIVNWPSKDPRYDTQGHGEMFQLTPRRATSRETSRLRARPTWRAGARGPAPPRDCPGSTGRLRGEWALPRELSSTRPATGSCAYRIQSSSERQRTDPVSAGLLTWRQIIGSSVPVSSMGAPSVCSRTARSLFQARGWAAA